MRHGSRPWWAAAFSALLLAGPPAARAEEAPMAVRSRSASHVYVDAGRDRDLSTGDRLLVREGDETVAELEVVFLSDHSAACRVVREERAVVAGDRVTAVPRAPAAAATDDEEVAVETLPRSLSEPSRGSRPSWGRAHGWVGLAYHSIWDATGSTQLIGQATARTSLTVSDIAGQPLTFRLRARARHNQRSRLLGPRPPAVLRSDQLPQESRLDRLPELTLRYETEDSGFAYEMGRLGSSRNIGTGYLDGSLLRVRVAPGVRLGAFFGESIVDGLRVFASGRKYGAFVEVAPEGRFSPNPFFAQVGAVREFAGPEISREYVTFEGRAGSTRGGWLLFARGDLDVNNGWRREAAGSAYQLSNVSAVFEKRLSGSSALSLTYDGRRSYRNARNRGIPADEWQDPLDRGFRARIDLGTDRGLSLNAGAGLRLRDGDDETAYSWFAGLRQGDLGGGVFVGADVAAYSTLFTDSYLVVAHLGKRFGSAGDAEISYGQAGYTFKGLDADLSRRWVRLLVRLDLLARFYLQLDGEYDMGDEVRGPRGYVELGYVF